MLWFIFLNFFVFTNSAVIKNDLDVTKKDLNLAQSYLKNYTFSVEQQQGEVHKTTPISSTEIYQLAETRENNPLIRNRKRRSTRNKMPLPTRNNNEELLTKSAEVNDNDCTAYVDDLKEEVKKLKDLVELLHQQEKLLNTLRNQNEEIQAKVQSRDMKKFFENLTKLPANISNRDGLAQVRFKLNQAILGINKTTELLEFEKLRERELESELRRQKSAIDLLNFKVERLSNLTNNSEIVGSPLPQILKLPSVPTLKPISVKPNNISKTRESEGGFSELKKLLRDLNKEDRTDSLELSSKEIQSRVLELESHLKKRKRKQTVDKLRELEQQIKDSTSKAETKSDVDTELEELRKAIDRLRPKDDNDRFEEALNQLITQNNNNNKPATAAAAAAMSSKKMQTQLPPGVICTIDQNYIKKNIPAYQNGPNMYQNNAPSWYPYGASGYPSSQSDYLNWLPNPPAPYVNPAPSAGYQNIPNQYPNPGNSVYQGPQPDYQNGLSQPSGGYSSDPQNSQFFPNPLPVDYQKNPGNSYPAAVAPDPNQGKSTYAYQRLDDLRNQLNGLEVAINNLHAYKPEDKATIYNLDQQLTDLKNIVSTLNSNNAPSNYKYKRSSGYSPASNKLERTEDSWISKWFKNIPNNERHRRSVDDNEVNDDDLDGVVKVLGKLFERNKDNSVEDRIEGLKKELDALPKERDSTYPSYQTPYQTYQPAVYYPPAIAPLFPKTEEKKSKSTDIFTSIVSKIIDKIIASIPVVIKKLFNFSIDELGQYGEYGYNGDVYKIFKNFGVLGFLPILLLRFLAGIEALFKSLKYNKFFNYFLLPALSLLIVAGSVLFLIWWYQYNGYNDYSYNQDNYSDNYPTSYGSNYPANYAPSYPKTYPNNNKAVTNYANYPVYRSYFDNKV